MRKILVRTAVLGTLGLRAPWRYEPVVGSKQLNSTTYAMALNDCGITGPSGRRCRAPRARRQKCAARLGGEALEIEQSRRALAGLLRFIAQERILRGLIGSVLSGLDRQL